MGWMTEESGFDTWYNKYQGLFPWRSEVDQSPKSSAEVKNGELNVHSKCFHGMVLN
jgi:hypothetical protein